MSSREMAAEEVKYADSKGAEALIQERLARNLAYSPLISAIVVAAFATYNFYGAEAMEKTQEIDLPTLDITAFAILGGYVLILGAFGKAFSNQYKKGAKDNRGFESDARGRAVVWNQYADRDGEPK